MSAGTDTLGETVSVVIPTYGRPDSLARCVRGLSRQTRVADEVIVVVHRFDEATATRVQELASADMALRCERVHEHGLVAALNRGLDAARGTIVAFVDDDAVPAPDWLERIVNTYRRSERIAAVGGRDKVVIDGRVLDATSQPAFYRRREPPQVGRIQWWGRMIANHHLGAGAARDVDVLKGANMSFRRSAVCGHRFDERLRGHGAQVHSELSICLPLRARGLRVVYDPAILVWHYPAPRPHGDRRDADDTLALAAATHNEALQILDFLSPARRLAFRFWAVVVGTTAAPGFAVLARDVLAGRARPWSRFRAARRGRAEAWKTHRNSPRARARARGRRPNSNPGIGAFTTTVRGARAGSRDRYSERSGF